jgi:lysozyme
MKHGVDVSFAQGEIDWDAAKASLQLDFAYARATFGTNPADDDGDLFRRNHDECKRLQIPFGCYHFFRFDQDGNAQAEHFLEQINGRYGQLRAMVDVEEESGYGRDLDEMIANLAAFNAAVERALGARVIIYTNGDTWNGRMGGTSDFAGHQLWVADYTSAPAPEVMPAGFESWALWQYSDAGVLLRTDGTTCSVDLDRFAGDDLASIER